MASTSGTGFGSCLRDDDISCMLDEDLSSSDEETELPPPVNLDVPISEDESEEVSLNLDTENIDEQDDLDYLTTQSTTRPSKRRKKQSEDDNYSVVETIDPEFQHFQYTLLSGYQAPKPPLAKPTSPLEFFQLFFSDSLIQSIVAETNMYAKEHIKHPLQKRSVWNTWQDVSLAEMKAFLGVVLNMGMNPKPNISDYFTNDWLFKQSFFSDIFTRDRFHQIFWTLHVSSKSPSARTRSRRDKISNIVVHLQEKFTEYFVPPYEMSLDESTISFKGKIFFKQYNPKKPIKWGMKVFVLSDSRTGYIYTFEPYYGALTNDILPYPDLPFTARVVLLLAERLKAKCGEECGFHIYTDRYYTSLKLALELKKKRIHLTGTVMGNREGCPSGITKNKLKRKLKKHEILSYRHRDNVLVLVWRDVRDVIMLSSYHNNETQVLTRRQKKSRVEEQVTKPEVVIDYNERMGGVDTADHYVSSYMFVRKSKKWWRKMFFWLLDISIVNSYLLYNMDQLNIGKKPVEAKMFRKEVVRGLVGDVRHRDSRKRGRPGSSDVEERLNWTKPHFINLSTNKKTKECMVCSDRKGGNRRETVYFCETCQRKPGLHPGDCFKRYHTIKDYKP